MAEFTPIDDFEKRHEPLLRAISELELPSMTPEHEARLQAALARVPEERAAAGKRGVKNPPLSSITAFLGKRFLVPAPAAAAAVLLIVAAILYSLLKPSTATQSSMAVIRDTVRITESAPPPAPAPTASDIGRWMGFESKAAAIEHAPAIRPDMPLGMGGGEAPEIDTSLEGYIARLENAGREGPDHALYHFKAALGLHRSAPPLYMAMAGIYEKHGRHDMARALFWKAWSLGHAPAREELARSLDAHPALQGRKPAR